MVNNRPQTPSATPRGNWWEGQDIAQTMPVPISGAGVAPIAPSYGYAAPAPGMAAPGVAPQAGAPTAGAGTGLPTGYGTSPSYANGYQVSGFSAPGIAAPFTSSFNRPDPNSIANDPSYKFQFQQGMDAVQRSAASKGTLLTGGTMKDLTAFGQGLASTFDDKYWAREMGLYDRAYDTFRGNQSATAGLLGGMSSFGMQGAQGQAGAYSRQGQSASAGTINGQNAVNSAVGTTADALGDWFAQRRAKQAQAGYNPQNPDGSLEQ